MLHFKLGGRFTGTHLLVLIAYDTEFWLSVGSRGLAWIGNLSSRISLGLISHSLRLSLRKTEEVIHSLVTEVKGQQ